MDAYSRCLQFSVLVIAFGGFASSQTRNPNCKPAEALNRLLNCMDKIIPNMNHPVYAPIIGGADREYANDMCRSRAWVDGVQCIKQLVDDCSHDKDVHTLLTNLMPPGKVEAATRYFCDHRQEHFQYIQCYFDNKEALWDCYFLTAQRIAKYFYGNGITDTVDKWMSTMCRAFRNNTDCQTNAMTQPCGRPASEHLRTVTMKFYPDKCGAATLSSSTLLSAALAWVLTKLFW